MVPQWITDQIGEPPPKPPTDPEAYAAFPYEAKEAWREWNRKEDELVNKGFEVGQTLESMGYKNLPDQGKSMYSRYGKGGFFTTYGSNVDPNYRYDWASGRKYNIATSDQTYNQTHPNGEPITQSEYEGYQEAQRNKAAGATTYGQQAAQVAFDRAVAAGHFTYDPKSGRYYNIGHGNPNDPNTWQWVDAPINKAPTGSPGYKGSGGVSSFGDGGGYGGGGYGDPFGGGYGGGYSPGGEAASWGQANMSNAMAESLRNDIMGQQLQLQKGLEGKALGGSIYDYLLNEVYGPILGVKFDPNTEGVSQFAGQLNQQIQQPTFGTEYATAPDAKTALERAQTTLNGAITNQNVQGAQTSLDTALQSDPQANTYNAQQTLDNALPHQDGSASQNLAGANTSLAAAVAAQQASTATPSTSSTPSTTPPPSSPETVNTLTGQVSQFTGGQPATAQSALQQATGTLQNQIQARQTGSGVGTVQALGSTSPRGKYTQTGTQALDPNMNQTWARFLAPTYGKVGEQTKMNIGALERMAPRGGEQTKAITDAITGGYRQMQEGWQNLVPTALSGISDVGKEMYFQQPQQNNTLATAESGRQANQQYSLGLQQLKQQKDQSKWDMISKLGAAALGGAGTAIASDLRTKQDVKSFDRGLNEIRKLDPVAFSYNGFGDTVDGEPGISVMAQQLEKVMPEAVVKVPSSDGPIRAILPLALQMATVNAVKELDRRISSLSKRR